MTFEQVTNAAQRGAEIEPTWLQGRTLFGGALAAAAFRSIPTSDRRLHSLQGMFIAPGSNELSIETTELRTGKSMTFVRSDAKSERGVTAQFTFAFGAARESSIEKHPNAVTPRAVEDGFEQSYIEDVMPAFTQHFGYDWNSTHIPYTGADEAIIEGWVRHRTAPGEPVGALLGLIDAWPCPAISLLTAPAFASTVSWSISFMELPTEVNIEERFWFSSRAVFVKDGYAQMRGELYTADGIQIAQFEQLVAIFG